RVISPHTRYATARPLRCCWATRQASARQPRSSMCAAGWATSTSARHSATLPTWNHATSAVASPFVHRPSSEPRLLSTPQMPLTINLPGSSRMIRLSSQSDATAGSPVFASMYPYACFRARYLSVVIGYRKDLPAVYQIHRGRAVTIGSPSVETSNEVSAGAEGTQTAHRTRDGHNCRKPHAGLFKPHPPRGLHGVGSTQRTVTVMA